MISAFRKTLWDRRQCFSMPQALSWGWHYWQCWHYWQKWLEKPVNKQWLLGTSESPGKTSHPSKHEESVFWRERFPRRLARFYWTNAIIHFCYSSASFSKENFVYKFSDVLHLLKQKKKILCLGCYKRMISLVTGWDSWCIPLLEGASWDALQTLDADIQQVLENSVEETEGS